MAAEDNNGGNLQGLEDTDVVHISQGAMGAIVRSETEAQLDAAHKYKRSVKGFINEATTLATLDINIASACMYAIPRDGKTIEGPSVRLAEICASAYGNLHVGARVVGVDGQEIVAQGVCWDLEKNLRVTIEKRRRVASKNGKMYSGDMITVTGNAAASIGLRDAIFRVIPRAYVNAVYERARAVAVGDASTMHKRRQEIFDELIRMGALKERILAKIEKASLMDVGLGDIAILIGFANAIRQGEIMADVCFPDPNTPTVDAAGRDRGKVNVDDLKQAQEQNRGHSNENLAGGTSSSLSPPSGSGGSGNDPASGSVSGTQAPAQTSTTTTTAASADPPSTDNAKVDDDGWKDLQVLQMDNNVSHDTLNAFIRETLKYKTVSALKRKDLARVIAFVKAGGKDVHVPNQEAKQ